MPNERTREIYDFMAVSGVGKKQSAHDVFMPNSDLDTRDNCIAVVEYEEDRDTEYFCDDVDIKDEPVQRRNAVITITYPNGYTPQILARWKAYQESVAGAPSSSTANEAQTWTRSGTVSGGSFLASLTHEGRTYTTADTIAYDATNATILATLLKKTGGAESMGRLLRTGDIAITGTWGTAITLTFGGRFAGANMAQFVINDAAITGGGTIEEATTTAGSQKTHAISRSTDGTLAEFSIVVGDKNGAYEYQKIGNCSVDSISTPISQDGNPELTVVLKAYYVPEKEPSFSVPSCANLTSLKTEDCSLQINSVFQTQDVASLTATYNNNIPREAGFSYDDFDQTQAWQRGDRPTQEIAVSIYASPDDAIYQLAEANAVIGNEVPVYLNYGKPGNRVQVYCSGAKIKFARTPRGSAGPLRQKTVNLIITPHVSPPFTYTAYVDQSATFLTASS